MALANKTQGLGVDSSGGPVIDPTANVIALNDAATKRQDDLRELTQEINERQIAHVKELAELRERHQAELRKAEAARLDSIREVDRQDVNKTAAAAQTAITTLATTTTTMADTLRNQVAVAAQTAQAQLNNVTAEIVKRVSALELALSEGKGKQTVADPQLEKLTQVVEQMARNNSENRGSKEGGNAMMGWIFAGITLLIAGAGVVIAWVAK